MAKYMGCFLLLNCLFGTADKLKEDLIVGMPELMPMAIDLLNSSQGILEGFTYKEGFIFLTDMAMALATAHPAFFAAGAVGTLIKKVILKVETEEVQLLKALDVKIDKAIESMTAHVSYAVLASELDRKKTELVLVTTKFRHMKDTFSPSHADAFAEICKKAPPDEIAITLHNIVTSDKRNIDFRSTILKKAEADWSRKLLMQWFLSVFVDFHTAATYTQFCFGALGKPKDHITEYVKTHTRYLQEMVSTFGPVYDLFMYKYAQDKASKACGQHGAAPWLGGKNLKDDLEAGMPGVTWLVRSKASSNFEGEEDPHDFGSARWAAWATKAQNDGHINVTKNGRILGVEQHCKRNPSWLIGKGKSPLQWSYYVSWCENVHSNVDKKFILNKKLLHQFEHEINVLGKPDCFDLDEDLDRVPTFQEATFVSYSDDKQRERHFFTDGSLCAKKIVQCKMAIAFNVKSTD